MARPDFPNPYTILTPNMISRIRSDQEVYDRDPERWERQERQRKEEREQERLQEEDFYRQQENER